MPVLYYVSTGDREFGPAPLDTLRAWKEEGRLGPTTPVRVEGAREWFPAENIAALYPEPGEMEAISENPGSSAPPPLPADFRAGNLIAQTFQTYRKEFLRFFLIALPLLPMSVVIGICSEYVGPLGQITPEALDRLKPTLPWFIPAFLAYQLLWPIVCGALAVSAALVLDGKRATSRAVLGGLAGNIYRLIGGYLLTLCFYALVLLPPLALAPLTLRTASDNSKALLSLVILCGVAVSMFLATRICIDLMVRNQVILFESRNVWDAIRRSRNLMAVRSGTSWFERPAWLGSMVYLVWMLSGVALGMLAAIPIFGFIFGQVISGVDPAQAAAAITPLNPWSIAFQLLNGLAKCAVLPIAAIGMTVLYRRLSRSARVD